MRKKMILALMLAIVSSVWTLSNAMCLGSIPDAMYQPYTTVSGTIQALPIPCEPGEDCPPCLTEAIVTNDKTYYLTTKNQQVADFLEQIQTSPLPAIYLLPLKATASGTPYQMGSFDYLLISSLNELSVEYFSDQQENKLPSLCNQWNIAKISNATGPLETIHTVKAFLGSDTIIESQNYVKLIEDGKYKGAMWDGESGVIYYIPAGSAHEYLLYDFNAQVGDRLTNLWYGGDPERCPNGYNATVLSISDETPRVFTVEVEYIISDSDGEHIEPWLVYWTEGVGLSDGPAGQFCPGPECACSCGQLVLCAYKNGEQVYVSDMGEQYGCVYNYDPYAAPADTIPLFSYTGDDPGSSTVDPVDPNQVVVTLKNDELTIKEFSGETISYQLTNLQSNNVPASRRAPQTQTLAQTQTFQNEVSLTLTEEGRYTLILTNPNWDYSIYGTFNYPQAKDGIDNTPGSSSDTCGKAHKILIDGQLLIEKNNKTYNVLGTPVK